MIRKKKISVPHYEFKTLYKEKIHMLELDLDYELISLSHGLKLNDEQEINRCKVRLKKIHSELEKFKAVLNIN